MLTKNIRRLFSQKPLIATGFNNLDQVLDHLKSEKATLCCIYLRNDWNPECQQTDQIINKVAATNTQYSFVQVDTGVVDLAKKYFQVRAEPEFVITALGTEMTRHIGVSQTNLENKLNKARQYYGSLELLDGTGEWEEFSEQYIDDWNHFEKKDDQWYR